MALVADHTPALVGGVIREPLRLVPAAKLYARPRLAPVASAPAMR